MRADGPGRNQGSPRGVSVRLMLYSRAFAPATGGMETFGLTLATTLAARGHAVVVATDTPSDGPEPPMFEVLRRRPVAELVRRARRCDLVHGNGFSLYALPIAQAARRPLVLTHGGMQAACLNGSGFHQGQRCEYVLARCAALTRREFGSAATARRLIRHAMGRAAVHLVARNVSVSDFVQRANALPRAVTIHNVANLPPAAGAAPPRDVNRVAYVGRLETEKGPDVLVRAAAACRRRGISVGVDLYGDGQERAALVALAAQLGVADSVVFHGRVDQAAVATAMLRAAAVVVPSACDEAYGIAAAEALSIGRIAIVSSAGGLPEAIDGLATAFAVGDTDALADLMIRATRDHAWREEQEAKAAVIGRAWTPEAQASAYERVYDEAISGNARLRPAGEV